MDPDATDPALVGACGLFCGACRSYRKGRCPGCRQNAKASWCKVRSCCLRQGFATCADCPDHPDPRTCVLFQNAVARLFGWVFRSDRAACIRRIRQVGRDAFAREMAAAGRQSLRPGT